MSSRQPSPPPALEAPPRQPPEDPANLDDASAVPWPWRLYAGLTAYLGLPVIAAWIALTIMLTPSFVSICPTSPRALKPASLVNWYCFGPNTVRVKV